MSNARANRARETLGGQALRAFTRTAPPNQGRDDPDIARREDPKGNGYSQRRDHQPAERRPGGAPDIEGDAIGGGRAVEILLGHKHRYRRPPGGRSEGAADAKQERRRQQERGRGEFQGDQTGENHGDREDRDFDRNQKAPGIDDVGQGSRGKGEQEQRQADGDLHKGHCDRIGVEAGDQPAGRGVEHRGPDVRDEARGPYDGERQMAERSPS